MVATTRVKQAFKRKSADDRRRELIAAGIACLGKGGMGAFTIDQICKQAGISRGLVNHHFKTKDELLSCIYADMTAHLIQDNDGRRDSDLLAQIIETSFDEETFNRSNMRAWLAIWGQVPSNPALNRMHKKRYKHYQRRIKSALRQASPGVPAGEDEDSVARQLIAIIDGLWLEYCLHSDAFSLATARSDCYRFLEAYGIKARPRSDH
jgi:TetR/AcrR family transcriptional regulator, transcriptional repressor of bet genes